MKSLLGKLYETTERNLRISSGWICQKVHKQKLSMFELLTGGKGGVEGLVTTCEHTPLCLVS